MVHGEDIHVSMNGYSDIRDITTEVSAIIDRSGIQSGLVTVFAVGSTASVTTIEYEPALVDDMRDQLERFAPSGMQTRHSQTWGDDNGFSHLRATFMGPGVTIPVSEGKMVLGTWQQVVVIDHDNRPRKRHVRVQLLGE